MATTADNQRWSQAWASALRALDLLAGKSTATAGSRIRRMEVSLGQVTAEVQERTHGLCQITITVEPLPEQAWLQVLEMFQQQVAGAPSIDPRTAFPENEAAFHRFCALIFPNRRQDLQSSCSCCAGDERACPALQAVYRQLGAMLDEEPVLLLRLRGREWQQVVQALQNQRSTSFHGPATTNGHLRTISQFEGMGPHEPAVTGDALSAQIGNFMGSRKQLETFHHHIAAPAIDLMILRRLGPLPEELADNVVDQQLAMLYRHVSREAEVLAYDLESGHEPDATGR